MTADNFLPVVSFTNTECDVREDLWGIFYRFTPGADATLRASLRSSFGDVDAMLSVYTGECDSLTCQSKTAMQNYIDRVLTWPMKAGITYHLLVSGTVLLAADTITSC